ncbi:hypothetical protein ARMGADRAFT_357188 [Armillaria gallica]|uniref:DUF6534 domain-containing protein n=1 Tax=Armillaria gallica TaxID=47427 RepID=A0A2H3DLW6_ARMGA|nr:hypothetical protein ARMGADRAFT_357188 [Armillaria gallica]
MYRFFPFRTGKTTTDTTCSPSPRLSHRKTVWTYHRRHSLALGTLRDSFCAIVSFYLAFPKDRQLVKYLVYGIYIVEFVQTMLVTRDAFVQFGYGFGDIEALTGVHLNWLIVPVMSAVVAFVGQGFYAYRIFILSTSRTIPAFVICVSLTSSVAAIITGVYSFETNDLTKLNDRKTSIAVGIWCGGSALCDVVIAICMAYYLTRRNPSFRQTRILVTKLVRLTIETGSVTAVVALLSLILFFVFPGQTFYSTPVFIIPKLHANTVYMVLNSRIRILGGRDTYMSSTDIIITAGSIMIQDTSSFSPQGSSGTDGRQGQASVVAIPKEVLDDDYEMRQMNDKTIGQEHGYAA